VVVLLSLTLRRVVRAGRGLLLVAACVAWPVKKRAAAAEREVSL
jgi:hypothetical protein